MSKKSPKPKKRTAKDQAWAEARKRHRLSERQARMARELGMNPRKLGKLDNHKQQPWKLPLPEFIEQIYRKTFHRDGALEPSSTAAPAPRPRRNKSAPLTIDLLREINRHLAEDAYEQRQQTASERDVWNEPPLCL